jgi:hypothetical protein
MSTKEQGTRGFNKCGVGGGVKTKAANEQIRPQDCMVDQVKNRKRQLREVFGEQVTPTKKRSTHSGCRHGGYYAGGDGGGGGEGEGGGGFMSKKIDVLMQQAKKLQLEMDDAQEKKGVLWKKETEIKKRKGGCGGDGVSPQRPVKKCVTHVPTACHAANADPMSKGGEEHRCNRVGTFERDLLGLEVRVATISFSVALLPTIPFTFLSFTPYSPSSLSFFVRVCLSLPPRGVQTMSRLSLPRIIYFWYNSGTRSSQNHKGNSRR